MSIFVFVNFLSYSQKPVEVSLELLDDNIIKGTTGLANTDLVTAFGKLQIPISKVSHIEIGLGIDNSVGEK